MPGLRETLAVFADSRPSLRELWASRTGTFTDAHVICPSTAVAGERVTASVQAWDEYERLLPEFDGAFAVTSTDDDAETPRRLAFSGTGIGRETVEVTFGAPGVHYLVLEREGERFVSNPVRVHESDPDTRVYWGDIHLHSKLSDGAGTMEKGYAFARDVMDLDVAAYTDHDTMGFFVPAQWQRRKMHRGGFERALDAAEQFNEEGAFVTLPAYEWTKQPNRGGHLNVYFKHSEDAKLFDSLDPETHTYRDLWDALREWRDAGHDVLTIPHHPAEAMYPFDFSEAYDDELAPLVEVYSQWGSSERRDDNPFPLAMGQGEIGEPGHYVQDALACGHRVGMLASSDYHGPFPGHSPIHCDPHLPSLREWREDGIGWGHIWRVWDERSYPGGLVAFRAAERSREGIFDALQSRAVYGTTQPARPLLDLEIDGVRVGEQGSEVVADGPRTVRVRAHGSAPLARVTVVKNNEPWHVHEPDQEGFDGWGYETTLTDDTPIEGLSYDAEQGTDADVYYLRVRQTDGAAGWCGPLWVHTP
ncbi:DUF3604 domain-containing protein [Natronomonas sp. EA1]|uniref:DUF3604 domain-containing protein n=1 Tax=Natronomonas sp. EA1 TaxID=3421655 RepID=UPI003EC12A17